MNKRQKGVAIVEFALVLPFLLLLTFITTEYGRAIWQYNTVTKSVRDAARYLSTQQPGTHITQARNLAVYGNLAGTGTPLALGLTLANVPVDSCCTWQEVSSTPVNGSAPLINTVTVRITGYSFHSVFASAFGVPFGTVLFSDITATMRSFL
jgi:Flp pilus assembly protein TadG